MYTIVYFLSHDSYYYFLPFPGIVLVSFYSLMFNDFAVLAFQGIELLPLTGRCFLKYRVGSPYLLDVGEVTRRGGRGGGGMQQLKPGVYRGW